MFDLHCHILPGMDDGAQTLEESLVMAQKAVQQGITHILCTPHYNQRFHNTKNEILEAVPKLQTELDKRDIPLTLFEGQEVRISDQMPEELAAGQLLCADVTDRYLLVEFPTRDIPDYAEVVLYKLCRQGVTPVIVHPERNREFQKEPNRLLPFLDMGCLAQLTAPSIVGEFGKDVQRLSHQLVQNRMVQMVASDAHGLKTRDFYLKEAYQYIHKEIDPQLIPYMDQVCRDIINGDPTTIAHYTGI